METVETKARTMGFTPGEARLLAMFDAAEREAGWRKAQRMLAEAGKRLAARN